MTDLPKRPSKDDTIIVDASHVLPPILSIFEILHARPPDPGPIDGPALERISAAVGITSGQAIDVLARMQAVGILRIWPDEATKNMNVALLVPDPPEKAPDGTMEWTIRREIADRLSLAVKDRDPRPRVGAIVEGGVVRIVIPEAEPAVSTPVKRAGAQKSGKIVERTANGVPPKEISLVSQPIPLPISPPSPPTVTGGAPLVKIARSMDSDVKEATLIAGQRLLGRGSFRDFLEMILPIVEPAMLYQSNWHVHAMCDHMEAVYRGEIRKLLLAVAGRHLKSTVVTVAYTPWIWTMNPSRRTIHASYIEKLVVRDSLKARQIVESDWYKKRFSDPDGWTLRKDQNTQDAFVTTQGGHRLALSVGGRALGEGGHCLGEHVLVSTEKGQIGIGELVSLKKRGVTLPRVWTVLRDGTLALRKIIAAEPTGCRKTIVFKTAGGRRLECTPDHRIWIDGAYKKASDAGHGSRLSVLQGHIHDACRSAPLEAKTGHRQPVLLHGLQEHRPPEGQDVDARLSVLQGHLHDARVQATQEDEGRLRQPVLLQEMQGRRRQERQEGHVGLPSMSEGVRSHRKRTTQSQEERLRQDVLLGALQEPRHQRVEEDARLPDVRNVVRPTSSERTRSRLLQAGVQASTQSQVASSAMPELFATIQTSVLGLGLLLFDLPQDREEEDAHVDPKHQASDRGTRSWALHDVHDATEPGDAPHRRGSKEQHSGEPDHPLQSVPHDPPQIGVDTVSAIGHHGDPEVDVYDLQVEESNCFFADGILVHNCLIVDDPQSSESVYSKADRERTNRWWLETMVTRCDDPRLSAFVVAQQRLHPEDLIGECMARDLGYEYLCLPSEYDPRRKCITYRTDPFSGLKVKFWEDPRTEEGELLFPQRFTPEVLADALKTLKPTAYAAQHQQNPSDAANAMFKPHWWRFWRPEGRATTSVEGEAPNRPVGCPKADDEPAIVLPAVMDQIVVHVDPTLLGEQSKDYAVAQVWGGVGPDRFLLEQYRDKFSIAQLTAILLDIHARYPLARIQIEESVVGPAIVADLKRLIPNVFGVKPEGSKEARAAGVMVLVEGGNVYLPEGARWLGDFVDEMSSFPGKHDDVVDCLSGALRTMMTLGVAGSMPVMAMRFDLFNNGRGMPAGVAPGRRSAPTSVHRTPSRGEIARKYR